MIDLQDELFKDMEAVRQIPMVPTMLEVICQITGMGFAAIARVTEDRWLACSVRDQVQFGLKEGEELKIETTLCQEVKNYQQAIIIDNVEEDPHYCNHHTPKIYKLKSYISVPIILKNGVFFGTLCAIDAKPAKLNNTKVIGTFTMFAELLSFHLQSLDLLERSYQTNIRLRKENSILTNVNNELDSFVCTASHDLKSPLSDIAGLLELLSDTVAKETLDRGEVNQILGLLKSSLQRFTGTLKELTAFLEADQKSAVEKTEEINIFQIVEKVKQDLHKLIHESNAKIEVSCTGNPLVKFSKNNFRSILYNLLSNAIKYRSPERTPEILVKMKKEDGKVQLSVTDNGLGIPAEKQEKVFTMFKRLHNHVEGSGLGLFIVKRMVEKNKGQVQVKSTLNQGTTFTIILNE